MVEKNYSSEQMLYSITVKIFKEDKQALQRIVNANPEKYDSVAHAARCAIQALVRREDENGRGSP